LGDVFRSSKSPKINLKTLNTNEKINLIFYCFEFGRV